MVFNSFSYFLFFAVFFCIYWFSTGKKRLVICLLASYFFYGWWDYRFCGLLIWSTLLDYFVGLRLYTSVGVQRKLLLLLSLGSNLAVLGFFKYFNFFSDSLKELLQYVGLQADWPTLNVILPVGISFYTFQTLSYTIDIYREKLAPERSLIRFATYVAFFPQLVAGPIVRAVDFLPQLKSDRQFKASEFQSGVGQFLLGMVKKVVIADSIAVVVDNVFAAPEAHTSLNVMIVVVLYAFQIYGDFSGYSDMAIGTASMLGYRFPRNFRCPYLATSLSDFWNRWHISLSSWLRDYLYIPLGGNRHGKWSTYRNLMLTMLLGGLWHGANWTFVAWGALHGAYLIAQRELSGYGFLSENTSASSARGTRGVIQQAFIRLWKTVFVFVLVCITWILFRAENFECAIDILSRIAALDDFRVASLRNRIPLAKACFLVGALYSMEILTEFWNLQKLVSSYPFIRFAFYAMLVWATLFFGTFDGNAFIYFQF